ncbi:dimethylaniline monooxygenase [N-oxide-forming] 2-like [Gigantopelta aegis]|uniref:dimethylaniline monooxygenase [N-oxide-forming] 2-like n=1 Tax=Gigantopelta aegis TaxID=1735272 RepID=UPI001B88E0E0|nr:dimethylaniline monooxygenase [N-oxide-forming] 2-like [Gigantopelta aegis]
MSTTRKTVAVIGAGISGLVSIKSCLEEGLEPVCFEQHDDIGGVWYNTDELRQGQGPRAYDSLVTNSSKDMMCFSDYPYPKHYPPYLTCQMVHSYLHSYAEHFQLKKYIQFQKKIVKVSKADDYDISGKWIVETESAEGDLNRHVVDAVMVCSGFYKIPHYPKVEGMEEFEGFKTHSQAFKTGQIYKDKTVLVVGNANSAGDIAADVSNYAKQVYLSVGDGCWILTRLTNGGIPRDFVHRRFLLQMMPESVVNRIIMQEANRNLDHETAGVRPDKPPLRSCVLVNDEIQMKVMSGKVKVVDRLKKLRQRSAHFADGNVARDVDGVVFATGFDRDLSFLDSSVGGDNDKLEFYKMAFPVHLRHQTLAMIGCFSTVGAHPPAFELQARLAARVFAGKHRLPSEDIMVKDVEKWNTFVKERTGYYKYKVIFKVVLSLFQFPTLLIRDDIATELGVKPKFWDLFWTDPRLAFSCFFGPAFPVQYRLLGPGAWDGAAHACRQVYTNSIMAVQHRRPPPFKGGVVSKYLRLIVTIFVLSGILYLIGLTG